MLLIQPTDILLGRGPGCYNNPGNMVFRKMVKEYAFHYTNTALRREKTAVVKMLIIKLEALGYRFLQRSSTGTWIEAPHHMAVNKNKKYTDQAKDNRAEITIDDEAPHCHGAPTKPEKNTNAFVSSPKTPFDFTSALQENPLAVLEEASKHRKNGCITVNTISEQRHHKPLSPSDSEVDQPSEHSDRRWEDLNDASMLPAVSPINWETRDAHVLHSVEATLNMYTAIYGRSIGNFFVGDPNETLGCQVEDAQSLCRWFSTQFCDWNQGCAQ
ncbi:hypothetical protein MHU86_2399 [Fragilaria crotonensis]|nr:hypothetical protein MHU86_2399 [Fragilaria crotonensis]